MEQKEVLYSVKEGIGRIVINRPEKKNALNMRTRQRLVEIMDEIARDENIQIVVITVIGVAIGGLLTFLFSLTFPPTVPIVFNGATSALAVTALLLIGPLGGLVSIRYAVRIEPLKALGLSS